MCIFLISCQINALGVPNTSNTSPTHPLSCKITCTGNNYIYLNCVSDPTRYSYYSNVNFIYKLNTSPCQKHYRVSHQT